jgi:acetyl-CoA acetyltransferase
VFDRDKGSGATAASGWAAAGCEPATRGLGAVPAVPLSFDKMEFVEFNEAFACQVQGIAAIFERTA